MFRLTPLIKVFKPNPVLRSLPRVVPVRWYTGAVEKQVKKKKKPTNSIQSLRRSIPNNGGDYSSIKSLSTDFKASDLLPITSITVGESIDFDKLIEILKNSKLSYSSLVPDEVIQLNFQEKDLLILANGTIVGWGFHEDVLFDEYIPLIQDSIVEKYIPESEEMDFIDLSNYSNNQGSFMQGEIMIIQGNNEIEKLLDKAAFSIGLSRSTRLSILENSLEKHIMLTKKNSQDLSNGLQIKTNESEILKLTGRLFLLRGKLNLYNELIETPDLYWSEPNLEKIYMSILKNLDIKPRIEILNRKLDYATEEQRALLSVLNEKKSTRLEWIIIVLIMVEVGFETFHFYERYFDKSDQEKN